MMWIIGIISLVVLLALLWPLWRTQNLSNIETNHITSAIDEYQRRLADLKRDEVRGIIGADEAKAAEAEISRRLLREQKQSAIAHAQAPVSSDHGEERSSRWEKPVLVMGFLLVGVIPALAIGLYWQIGNPGYGNQPFHEREDLSSTADGQALAQPSSEQIEQLIANLETRLAQNPQETDGWLLLARSYNALGRLQEAERAWKGLLAVQPANDDALWFLGVYAAQDNRPEEARDYWTELLSHYRPDTEEHGLIKQALDSLPTVLSDPSQ